MNLKNIRKELEDIKTYCNVNDSVYDFIQKHPNNYLLLFQTYLRKRGVNYMEKITHTKDLLDSDCFKGYRSDFESESKKIPLKDFIKR